jgi:hypothetical protein
MDEEDKLQRELSRAARAEALLRDELLTEAFDTLEQSYFKGFCNTAPADARGRERLHIAANQVSIIRNHLKFIASGGVMAQAQLNHIIKLSERKKAQA